MRRYSENARTQLEQAIEDHEEKERASKEKVTHQGSRSDDNLQTEGDDREREQESCTTNTTFAGKTRPEWSQP